MSAEQQSTQARQAWDAPHSAISTTHAPAKGDVCRCSLITKAGIPDSVKLLMLSQFTAEALHHMGGLKAAEALRARQSLSPQLLDELADILLAGHYPTIGWWKRALVRHQLVCEHMGVPA